MKKKLILGALALSFAIISCNKTDATVKIDFTKSYEDAASALATAQKNFDDAVQSKDESKIAIAKAALQEAQQKYESTKTELVKGGGKVNTDFEKAANTASQSISSGVSSSGIKTLESTKDDSSVPAYDPVKNVKEAVTTTKDAVQNLPKTVVENTKSEIKNQVDTKVEKAKTDIKNTTDKAKTDIQNGVDKAKADLKAKNDEVKKNVDAEVNKAKDKLNQFLQK